MPTILSHAEIAAQLPVKRPLLMLDRLSVDAAAGKAVGIKNVCMNENYFQGHFPGSPIMPGVLQVAALSQAAAVLLKTRQGAGADMIPWVTSLERVKFRKPVVPGDRLQVAVEIMAENDGCFTCKGVSSVAGETACQGNVSIRLRPREELLAAMAGKPFDPPLAVLPGVGCQSPLNVEKIMAAIPHRYPFLLIDRALHMSAAEQRAVAVKNVTAAEPWFEGLSVPAFPPYFQVEAAAQAGCALALALPGNENKLGYFMSIDNASFLEPAGPGDQLLIELTADLRGKFGKAAAKIHVGDRLITEIAIKFAIVERGEEQQG